MDLHRTSETLIDETPKLRESRYPPARLTLIAILLSFGTSFNFGFQLLITNPAQEAFIEFLNDSKSQMGLATNHNYTQLENEWSIIVATFFLGSLIGAFLIRLVSEKAGRRNGLIICVSLQFLSAILAIISFLLVHHTLFTISRLLMGVGITTSMGISAIFITESSPTYCRGVTSLINGVVLQFSLCVGAIMAMPELLGTRENWWMLYLFQSLTTLGVLLLLPTIHESPGYLIAHRQLEKAMDSLQFYHSIPRVSAQQTARRLEMAQLGSPTISVFSVWCNAFLARRTLLGMLVNWSMAMTGVTVINAFAFEILLHTGMQRYQASVANVLVCTMSFVGILVSTRIIDSYGRRPLLLTTFGFLAFINILIVILMYARQNFGHPILGYLLVISICIFNFLFAMGPGPVSLFISGELVPQSARSISTTWANAAMASTRFTILSIYIPLRNASCEPAAYAILFIAPMVLATIALYFLLPETKNVSVEQIEQQFLRPKIHE